ncbi:MAG: metal ABC transporter permease [Cocleimonas sp.]|nr:metal ABC transporter permease [Cocleimonas sp.]
MDDFLLRALLAGLAVTFISAPLGCFIIWRRMAYFGDTLSHSAILGVALGLLFSFNVSVGILLSSVAVAVFLLLFQGKKNQGSDALLGIIAHSTLSLGLVVFSFVKGTNTELSTWLFGDILTVTWSEVGYIALAVVLVWTLLAIIWNPLMTLTIDEELAKVEGVNVTLVSFVYTLLIAILVAVAMKIVGALLITSLLIIPAATARPLSQTAGQMALYAIGVGVIAVLGGLTASFIWDTPTAPSIVVMASLLFIASQLSIRPTH